LRNLFIGDYLHFSALADLCKEMSTKSNDNAAAAGAGSAAPEHFSAKWNLVGRKKMLLTNN
jgi:hypothetical protein